MADQFKMGEVVQLKSGGPKMTHIYCVYVEPGGSIGAHPAGFAQLFLVVNGSGWATGPDGERIALTAGQGVYVSPGEVHAKGSESGMTAIMVQADHLQPETP
jgi:quercetin dioxygenase-like cupin family protein